MSKNISVITNAKDVTKFYSQKLKELFGDLISVKTFSFEDGSYKNIENSDLYVITTSAYELLSEKFLEKNNIVVVDLTITKETLSILKKFPNGTKAALMNVNLKMCIETMSDFYHLGINNIEFYPIHPNSQSIPNVPLVITPGEIDDIPKSLKKKKIIDIGHRFFDGNTIIEIALKLGYEHLLYSKKINEYLDRIASNDYSLIKILKKATTSESQLDILLKTINIGIIGVDRDNIICSCNRDAESIIQISKDNLIGYSYLEQLSIIPFNEVKKNKVEIKSKLVEINGDFIKLNVTPIIRNDNYIGAFAFIQHFQEEELRHHEFRKQLLNKGHRARYNFSDILGEDSCILRVKEIAKKMARTESSILITGETGTGKELFAHSIHNYSKRKNFPFVIINCGIIPYNYLEKELFGYEDEVGNRKIGLLECAHMGTIFLDKVEEMTPALQIRLLRVLQEKTITRVAGDKVIDIDVRIIAASNENLKDLVQKGRFRKDLYYRLNTLPIFIPSLRERKQDIEIFIKKFQKEFHGDFTFNEKVKRVFESHRWDGNIRELRNYIEFLTYIDKKEIVFSDLPSELIEIYQSNLNANNENFEQYNNLLLEVAQKKYDEYIFVLTTISKNNLAKISSGRNTLYVEATKENISLSENDIRKILLNLENLGFIENKKGRKGATLSEIGLKFLEKN